MADQFKTQDYYKMLTHVVHELPHSKPGDLYSERFLLFFLIFVTYQCSKKVKLTINFHAFPSVNFLKIVLFFNSCSTYLQTVFILLKFVRANCLY